jgi:hypothetical protein
MSPVRPKRNPAIAWRLEKGMHAVAWDKFRKDEEYEELGVLTLMVGESIHQLNLVGAEIWTRVNGINTVEKIAAQVASLFEWDPEEAEEAVRDFLAGIGDQGWVTLEGPSKQERSPK